MFYIEIEAPIDILSRAWLPIALQPKNGQSSMALSIQFRSKSKE